MQASVILSTYNSPAWLEKVLTGYMWQSTHDFEMIIADDGSRQETKTLVNRLRLQAPFNIKHVWHQDDGFRKCRILNKAVLHAETPYIIFSDGDCIPRADFIATHLRRAESGYFLSGSYFKLPMNTSATISHDDIRSGRCFDKHWLYANGLPRLRKTLKISAGEKRAPLFNALTPAKCNFKGSNASVWRQDILNVNGFDERMPWGGEDREFGVRLVNSGIKARHVRYDAICLHLDHARAYVDPALVKRNKALRLSNERTKVKQTHYGIQQLIEAGYVPALKETFGVPGSVSELSAFDFQLQTI